MRVFAYTHNKYIRLPAMFTGGQLIPMQKPRKPVEGRGEVFCSAQSRSMLSPLNIDPVAVRIGPLSVHWYGLMYLLAFALFWLLARLRLRHEPFASATPPWTRESVEDLLFWGVLGVVLGGRLGYCLFYGNGEYLAHTGDLPVRGAHAPLRVGEDNHRI